MSDTYSTAVDQLDPTPAGGRYVRIRMAGIPVANAFAARRVIDGREALLLDVSTAALGAVKEWPDARGFEIFAKALVPGPHGTTRVHLQLTNSRYGGVFRTLCESICELLRAASSDEEAARTLNRQILRWQAFLEKHGPEGLSDGARCGLAGELIVLRDLLLPRVPADQAVRAWRGCKGASQDFQFRGCALEVKTTRAVTPERISISNVQQLDDAGIENMYLVVVQVHENDSAGDTLPEIVDAIEVSLSPTGREAYRSGLEEVGYLEAHRELYAGTRYRLDAIRYFGVAGAFPRILRDHVPDGVVYVNYRISLGACLPHEVTESTVCQSVENATREQDGLSSCQTPC